MFVGDSTPVYQGMVIGEHVLEADMEMNPCKAKKQTNIRAAGTDEAIRLIPHKAFSLEEAVSYIRDDEIVEVTPKWIRIRKKILDQGERQRIVRDAKNKKLNK